tara:strand:+ start:4965 stop:5099 length:135 start_codon:yes stop_codon:yes gene_type:complete
MKTAKTVKIAKTVKTAKTYDNLLLKYTFLVLKNLLHLKYLKCNK